MNDGPIIAAIAALVGDPARANMLTALMDGRALTVSELSGVAGVALPTASGHLAKLNEAGLLIAERQGRNRYFRLSGPDVADVLEGLMGLAERTGAKRFRTGPRDAALREARICYDHLAGERAVAMLAAFRGRGYLSPAQDMRVTDEGEAFFSSLGIDTRLLARSRRPLCRGCLDWSERRPHLAGALGAAILERMLAAGWARRADGRRIMFTPSGEQMLKDRFSAS